MSNPMVVTSSMLEFLRWVAARPRTYRETMDAWRTSCPRLSVWEDSLIAGLVQVQNADGDAAGESGPASVVAITERGLALLDGGRD